MAMGTITPEALAAAEVFHSPFFALPWRIRRERRIKKFLTVHDLIAILHPNLAPAGNTMRRIIGSLGPEDWALCVSQATKDDLCEFRPELDPRRCMVVHLAASDQFHPCHDPQAQRRVRVKYGIPPDVPYVLSVNTLEGRKNIESVVRAFARVVTHEKMADLYLVLSGGKGWNFEELMREIERNPGVRERIVLTGFVDDADLPALYSSALAFIYPSLYEGFGLPPLEAMQCGTPVITSNTTSLPEVVGDAGLTVTPTDLDAICQAIVSLYRSDSLRGTLSEKGLAQARKFSWERCAAETAAAYRSALAE